MLHILLILICLGLVVVLRWAILVALIWLAIAGLIVGLFVSPEFREGVLGVSLAVGMIGAICSGAWYACVWLESVGPKYLDWLARKLRLVLFGSEERRPAKPPRVKTESSIRAND